MTAAKQVDWEAIELAYRSGALSVREIAKQYGVSHAAIHKRAKARSWPARALERKPVVLSQDPGMENHSSGFVYVVYLEAAGDRFYKIGMARTFADRLSAHQCSSPFELFVAVAYFSGDMRAEEAELHREFAEKRVRGEWFALDEDDLRWIATRSLQVAA